MTVSLSHTWEHQLLLWAEQANKTTPDRFAPTSGHDDLSVAYAHCAEITRQNSRTFYLASQLLPLDKRRAARALYALCRVTDNLVDDPAPGTIPDEQTLEDWRVKVHAEVPDENDLVLVAWSHARQHFKIPTGFSDQLIDGVKRDLTQTRCASFDDLARYSYGVASTVGLMAMHIIGFRGDAAIPYAVRLGVALQITNILRDVGEDWRAGRVYLPQDELTAFGLSDADIARGQVNDAWRSFMQFQIARNRRLYQESWAGLAALDSDGRFAIAAAGKLYDAILGDIIAHDYDVFSRRAHIGTVGKLVRMPGIWWLSRKSDFAR